MQAHVIRRLPTALAAVLLSAGLFYSGNPSAALLAADAPATKQPQLTFETDIRPLLKVHCLHCHGEAGEKEGGLDLRLKRLMVAGGDSGPSIEPGKPAASLLLERVRSGDMPPGDDKRLPEEEIQRIADWVAAGAHTAEPEPAAEQIGDGPIFTSMERKFWSFQPIVRPPVPTVADASRIRTPIDAFVLARLKQEAASSSSPQENFTLAADADRLRFIRRACFDLIGLPPTPAQIDEFLADTAAGAEQRLINRLLESPHYGERWGRHWLDVVGYADSEGYNEEDRVRPHAWRYRDYVIRAFNADKPFDQFVTEQLAGDELVPRPHENLTAEQIDILAATGFLRMAPDGTASGGIDQAVARNQVMADTLQIVSTSLLGMTVHCAQCHDHKYDPIPQADYYRMRSIFEPALDWSNWKVPAARQLSLYTDADRELAKQIEAEAAAVDAARLKKTEEYITRTLEEELLLVPEDIRETLRTAYRTAGKERTDEQQALLKKYPSVASISAGSLYLYDRRRSARAAKLDQERKAKEPQFVAETRRQALEQVPADQRAAVEQAADAATEQRTDEQRALLAQFPAVLVTAATLEQFNPEAAAELKRLADEATELRASKAADDLKTYTEKAAAIRETKPVEGFVRMLTEEPGRVPPTKVFYRGDHEQPKDDVLPADLSILASAGAPIELPAKLEELPTTGRRLAYAKHLTSGTHPLFARVIVNRIWLQHFGRGLVASPADFGVLGELPTHPELLDWLATEFVRSGWSVKHMHRLIMASTVYRQTSVVDEAIVNADPLNRLLMRFPLRRLESEIVRDAMLAVSGKLNPKLAGEPVPVMEDAVGQIILGVEKLDGERKPTKAVPLDGEEFRRSIYVQVRRSRTLSVLEAFDAPDMSPNCEKRTASTVALQSLMLMNGQFAVETAAQLADRLLAEAGTDRNAQLTLGWKLAFGRNITPDDLNASVEFLTQQEQELATRMKQEGPAAVQRQALATWCQALFSSSRFLYYD